MGKGEIKKIAQKIARKFNPDKIILFGSWAWGNPGPDSDIDLCVIKKTSDTRALARQIDTALFPRAYPLDLIVCDPDQLAKRATMGDFFIHDILQRGMVLYAK